MVDKLRDAINYKGPKTIYLTSEGGSFPHAIDMIDYINHCDDIVEVVGSDALYSAALDLFNAITRPKRILPHTSGMVHMSSKTVRFNERGKPYNNNDIFDLKQHKKQWKEVTLKLCKDLKLSKKKIKDVKRGSNVFISYKHLKKIYG